MLIDDCHQELEGDQLAYVALSVNAGGFNDPMHRQGLAHLLEHMIFMGSPLYDQEGAFDEHLTSHGGSSNAFTMYETTTYHFSV